MGEEATERYKKAPRGEFPFTFPKILGKSTHSQLKIANLEFLFVAYNQPVGFVAS